jgi:hypothetical protein
MHSRPCDLPEPRCRPWGLKGPVSPLPTGDRNHTGDRNLPLNSMLSPLSPVSPVARAREGFRNTIRFENPGRVQYARVDFSETSGDGGDTGDRGRGPGAEALLLRRRHSTGPIVPDDGRPLPDCGDRQHGGPATGAGAAPQGAAAAATTTSAAEQLRTLANRVRRLGLAGRFDPEAAFIERDELAHPLRRLAVGLERDAARMPPATPSASRGVLPRRFAAVLAAMTSQIACLRRLLAQVERPARRRRRATSDAQLVLPLLEVVHDR